jgi:tetratricopeptide (TPR) repeat protein
LAGGLTCDALGSKHYLEHVRLETTLKFMADPENSNKGFDNPLVPPKNEPNSLSMDAFKRALKGYEQGALGNNIEQMEAAALSALALAVEEAEQHPTPELELQQAAHECESHGDWAGAEACRRKVLTLQEAKGNSGLISKAHYDLSRLFLLVGDLEKAEACARAATTAARQTGIFPILVMSLENQALCALRRSDYTHALEAASEAVAAVELGRMYHQMRAGALVTRARCRLASGDLAGSESDLTECKPSLLGRETSPIFAGTHSRVAGWWEVTAGVRARMGDMQGTCEAWAEAVKHRRHVASLAQVSGPYTLAALAHAMQRLGEAFDAAGKPEDAKTAVAEARTICCGLGLPELVLR